MRRSLLILLLGLTGAVAGYCAFYFFKTAGPRTLLASPAPELAWLQKEFNLSAPELERITELHQGYLPRCEEMCRRIAEKNAEIKQALAEPEVATRLVEQKLAEAGQLRLQCQTNMLHHFIAVSRQMPPEQGRRYLAWIEERTLTESSGMMAHHASGPATSGTNRPAAPHHHH
jgi:hypothetical protein